MFSNFSDHPERLLALLVFFGIVGFTLQVYINVKKIKREPTTAVVRVPDIRDFTNVQARGWLDLDLSL
jgi:hypothetical protein